ncbi:uncharacterized protein LODBEIA_P15410 [Lodderomyces beijingensis]|uniref:White-opaque regulator 3 n=1 Tax=Lodderomyces beijingensis TaxID=1775926 RepID=A0ABP0ZGM7_9ASCO
MDQHYQEGSYEQNVKASTSNQRQSPEQGSGQEQLQQVSNPQLYPDQYLQQRPHSGYYTDARYSSTQPPQHLSLGQQQGSYNYQPLQPVRQSMGLPPAPQFPLHNSNYIASSYTQIPTQSPYPTPSQAPQAPQAASAPQVPQVTAQQQSRSSQPNQSPETNARERRSYDDRYEDTNNTLYYGNDRNIIAPIPPLHIQQQLFTKNEGHPLGVENPEAPGGEGGGGGGTSMPASQGNIANGNGARDEEKTLAEVKLEAEEHEMIRSTCTRCKKEFMQRIIIPKTNETSGGGSKALAEPKIFKLCDHCRDLQRQRSRRWQKKTKDKQGVCRRCGTEIPHDERKFVLCPSCRQNLRTRKASRAAQGKCVHCSGPLDASILIKNEDGNVVVSTDLSPTLRAHDDEPATRDGHGGSYKVCQRCRENDKIRRTNLEKLGNCNRCAKPLDSSDYGRHKVCSYCRSRKKRVSRTSVGGGGGGNGEEHYAMPHPQYGVGHDQQQQHQQGMMHHHAVAHLQSIPGSSAVEAPYSNGISMQHPTGYPQPYLPYPGYTPQPQQQQPHQQQQQPLPQSYPIVPIGQYPTHQQQYYTQQAHQTLPPSAHHQPQEQSEEYNSGNYQSHR